jgi:hypothetical protein
MYYRKYYISVSLGIPDINRIINSYLMPDMKVFVQKEDKIVVETIPQI